MGKVLSILIGLILIALGVWGVFVWPDEVWSFVKSGIVVMIIIIGLGVLVFGISELRGGEEPPVVAPPPPAEQPPAPTTQ